MCLTPTGRFTVVEGRLEPKVRASTLWIHHKKYNDKCRRVLEIFDEGKWKVLAAVDSEEESKESDENIFWVKYQSTPITEIIQAYEAGKIMVCLYDNKLYVFSDTDTECYTFTSVLGSLVYHIGVHIDNSWEEGYTELATREEVYEGNKVFTAVFGETTFDAIEDALDEGKVVMCLYQSRVYTLVDLDEQMDSWIFTAVSAGLFETTGTIYYIKCKQHGIPGYDEATNGWSSGSKTITAR